mmetsp:Transcript_34982/g.62986  ORF Transcript_34982/g.62986 Transcript_34982/m.62986 type:complete len:104 (-) Transcript_34982:82-393(-)
MKPMPPNRLPPNSIMQTNLLPTNDAALDVHESAADATESATYDITVSSAEFATTTFDAAPSATNKSDDADLDSHVSVNRRIQRICFRCFGRIRCCQTAVSATN